MPATAKTKRQKLQAMADQTASPNEALVAQAMLANTPEGALERIVERIKAEWGKGIESQFEVGRLLSETWNSFEDAPVNGGRKVAYGRWFSAQDFPFSTTTGYKLRVGHERKDEVLALMAKHRSERDVAKDISVGYAVALLIAPAKSPAIGGEAFEATPADPAYVALRAAYNRIFDMEVGEDGENRATGNAFLSMHVDDLASSADIIKAFVTGYQAARAARS